MRRIASALLITIIVSFGLSACSSGITSGTVTALTTKSVNDFDRICDSRGKNCRNVFDDVETDYLVTLTADGKTNQLYVPRATWESLQVGQFYDGHDASVFRIDED